MSVSVLIESAFPAGFVIYNYGTPGRSGYLGLGYAWSSDS